jgi:tetratricopeptide (TPR) repeat protein
VPVRRNEDPQTDPKYRSNIHHLQLREIKVSNRYKEQERDQRAESFQLPMGDTERVRPRAAKEGPLTTRNNREEVSVERPEMFKIKRKSISGSLKKKLKEAQTHHLSSVNPTVPLELNYFEEGKRVYKEGKVGEALRLFELAVERSPDLADGYYHCALCHLSKRNYQRSYDFLTLLVQKFPAFDRKTVPLFTAIAANHLSLPDKALSALTSGVTRYPDFLDLYVYRAKVSEGQGQLDDAQEDYEFVLKTKRDSPEVLLGYALLLQRKGLTTNALSALGSALYSDKGDLRGKILLARVRMNYSLGRLDECKKDLPRLCEL